MEIKPSNSASSCGERGRLLTLSQRTQLTNSQKDRLPINNNQSRLTASTLSFQQIEPSVGEFSGIRWRGQTQRILLFFGSEIPQQWLPLGE